jgi:hypothetical protein
LQKCCLSNYLLCFLFNKIREEGGTGSSWNRGGRKKEVFQTMYTHVSKCKTDKERKKESLLFYIAPLSIEINCSYKTTTGRQKHRSEK